MNKFKYTPLDSPVCKTDHYVVALKLMSYHGGRKYVTLNIPNNDNQMLLETVKIQLGWILDLAHINFEFDNKDVYLVIPIKQASVDKGLMSLLTYRKIYHPLSRDNIHQGEIIEGEKWKCELLGVATNSLTQPEDIIYL